METYIVKVPITGKVEIVPFDKDNSYEQLNKAVGGWLEAVPLIPAIKTSEPYVIDLFVDEEGLLKALPLNTRLSFFCSAFLAGNAVFVAHDNMGETVGLTKADAESIVKTINNVGV